MDFVEWIDIIVISLVVILGIKGAINGLIKEIFGLIGLIGGIIIASRNAHYVGGLIDEYIYKINDSSSFFFGFLATLIIFWIACLIAGNLLSKMVKLSGLGALNRLLGFFIGSAKIFLVFAVLSAIVAKISILNQKINPYFLKSKIYPVMLYSGEFIMNMDLSNIKNEILNKVGDLNKSTNSTLDTLDNTENAKTSGPDLNISVFERNQSQPNSDFGTFNSIREEVDDKNR